MTEHEKLKAICDEIDFIWGGNNHLIYNQTDGVWERTTLHKLGSGICDVREIIFTPEFMEKYNDYIWRSMEFPGMFENEILKHLGDPVSYLYNLLEL